MAMADDSSIQRISRLTPLGVIFDLIESQVSAVPPQVSALTDAAGRTLAADVTTADVPPRPIALRDGFAVDASAIAGAGPYAPAALPLAARRIDAGEPLPAGANAVLSRDAVVLRGPRADVVAEVAAGEGVLPTGGDALSQAPLRRAGERLRRLDIAVLVAAGVHAVHVRAPRVRIVRSGTSNTVLLGAALDLLADLVARCGAVVVRDGLAFDETLRDDTVDAVIGVGGTGDGRRDAAVHTFARVGNLAAHGIAVSPGQTAAFGFSGPRPVLLIPGRLDAVLALWLLLGRLLLARLAGGVVQDASIQRPLKHKVASAIGLTELVPVRCADGMAEPLGSGYLSFATLSRSDGWIISPAESEGFAAGSRVAVQAWP